MTYGESHVRSYYAATANDLIDHPVLQGEVRTDVCVVGGGYAGLSTALELAKRGFETTLLEANRIGWGASGRNGGQIVSGFACGMTKIEKWLGKEDAKLLWRLTEEAKSLISDRVREYSIECDLKPGYLFAATKNRHMNDLRSELDHMRREYDYDEFRLLGREEMRAEVNSESYCGGLLDKGGGHLHPLNYALGLARAASEAGVRVYEQSQVTRIQTGLDPFVETDKGEVRSKYLVLCGNAYLGELVPRLRRKIMPVGTYIIATEPLAAEKARQLIPNDIAVADVNFVLDYFRLSADHRMLFGGKVSYTTLPPPSLEATMRRSMMNIFPKLAEARIDYVWGGFVAITVERSPHIGRLDGDVYFAHGFSGHGVAMTGIAGHVIAETIAGTAERFDLFARLPHQSFIGGRVLRAPLLALAMAYMRTRDLL